MAITIPFPNAKVPVSLPDRTPNPEAAPERLLWSGKPSHLLWWREFLWRFAFLGIALEVGNYFRYTHPALWLLSLWPLGSLVFRWLSNRAFRFEITESRVRRWTGLFSRHLHEIELYHLNIEIDFDAPWFLRILGRGTLGLYSVYGNGWPNMYFPAIRKPLEVRELLRTRILAARESRDIGYMEAL